MQSRTNYDAGYWNAENINAGSVVANAFGLQTFQYVGVPGWATSERWDIRGKIGMDRQPSPAEMHAMIEALLVDRFQMKYHRETRQMPIYALTVVKSGFKARPSDTGRARSLRMSVNDHRAEATQFQVTIADLIDTLSPRLERMVVDETGLTEHYDLHLQWDPDPNADSQLPSVFTALQEQLGLKLESRTGPVDVVVIDRLERPSN